MSAANLILKPTAAYLISDAASLNDDGTVAEIASKVIAFPHLRLALSYRGRVHPPTLKRELELMNAQTAAEFVARLPDALSALMGILKCQWPDMPDSEWSSTLKVIAWLPERDRPYCFLLATDNDWVPRPYVPWSMLSVTDSFAPGPAQNPELSFPIMTEPFDPVAFGIEMLGTQRHCKHLLMGRQYHAVGGFGELTQVTADAVTTTRICSWPDQVGHAIDPQAEMTRFVDQI